MENARYSRWSFFFLIEIILGTISSNRDLKLWNPGWWPNWEYSTAEQYYSQSVSNIIRLWSCWFPFNWKAIANWIKNWLWKRRKNMLQIYGYKISFLLHLNDNILWMSSHWRKSSDFLIFSYISDWFKSILWMTILNTRG